MECFPEASIAPIFAESRQPNTQVICTASVRRRVERLDRARRIRAKRLRKSKDSADNGTDQRHQPDERELPKALRWRKDRRAKYRDRCEDVGEDDDREQKKSHFQSPQRPTKYQPSAALRSTSPILLPSTIQMVPFGGVAT